MKTWWTKKKAKSRNSKKSYDENTFWDGIVEILIWIPELVFLPFRVIFWLLRGIGKVNGNIYDAV